jgi:hypothetical protein
MGVRACSETGIFSFEGKPLFIRKQVIVYPKASGNTFGYINRLIYVKI